MIVINNFIILCKYMISNIFGLGVNSIEFEYTKEDKEDNNDTCYCNLCYTFRNIILFTSRQLKCKNYNQ
jgi:hypothetical protein